MASRINTTAASADSAEFTPTGDVVLQAKIGSAQAIPTIAIMGRNDPTADLQVLMLWHPKSDPFIKFTPAKSILLRMTLNIAGNNLQVWDNA